MPATSRAPSSEASCISASPDKCSKLCVSFEEQILLSALAARFLFTHSNGELCVFQPPLLEKPFRIFFHSITHILLHSLQANLRAHIAHSDNAASAPQPTYLMYCSPSHCRLDSDLSAMGSRCASDNDPCHQTWSCCTIPSCLTPLARFFCDLSFDVHQLPANPVAIAPTHVVLHALPRPLLLSRQPVRHFSLITVMHLLKHKSGALSCCSKLQLRTPRASP